MADIWSPSHPWIPADPGVFCFESIRGELLWISATSWTLVRGEDRPVTGSTRSLAAAAIVACYLGLHGDEPWPVPWCGGEDTEDVAYCLTEASYAKDASVWHHEQALAHRDIAKRAELLDMPSAGDHRRLAARSARLAGRLRYRASKMWVQAMVYAITVPGLRDALVPTQIKGASPDARRTPVPPLRKIKGASRDARGTPVPPSRAEAAPPSTPIPAPTPVRWRTCPDCDGTGLACADTALHMDSCFRCANTGRVRVQNPCPSGFCTLDAGHSGPHADNRGNQWQENPTPSTRRIADVALRCWPGAWQVRHQLVELALDDRQGGDGIELEPVDADQVGLHAHVTIPAAHLPEAMRHMLRLARRQCAYQHPLGAVCALEAGHDGAHTYRCHGPSCPGLAWPESERIRHPETCRKG